MLKHTGAFFKEKTTEEGRAIKVYPLAVYESIWRRNLGKYARRIGRRSPPREIYFTMKEPVGSVHIHPDRSRQLYDLTGKPVSSKQELLDILESSRYRLHGTLPVERHVTYDKVEVMRTRLTEARANSNLVNN